MVALLFLEYVFLLVYHLDAILQKTELQVDSTQNDCDD